MRGDGQGGGRGQRSETLARDRMLAILIIVLNGLVGACLLAGALRYREQTYNLYSANSFLAMILPLAVLGLVLPSVTVTTPGCSSPRRFREYGIGALRAPAALGGLLVAVLIRADWRRAPAAVVPLAKQIAVPIGSSRT